MSYHIIYRGETLTADEFMQKYELDERAQYAALEAMTDNAEVMAQVEHDLWPAPSAGTMLAYWLEGADCDLVID